jgi:tricarballylate dehydrogenase
MQGGCHIAMGDAGELSTDIVIVGGGNAAMCAALAACDRGADVVVLERAPVELRGGNTAFTAGAMRVTYSDVDELGEIVRDLSAEELRTSDFGSYTEQQFFDDMARVTDHRADPDLVETLVVNSHSTLVWMADHGIRFAPAYSRQAFKVDGTFRFWGGLTVEVVGGGMGLVDAEHTLAAKAGADIRYSAPARSLLVDDEGVHGVRAVIDGRTVDVSAPAVVLACGGFQANVEWRTRYLGPGWDLAKVRGTAFNTGDGHAMALAVGAASAGHWSGCHAVAWDRNAPEFGDLSVGDGFQKHSYPLGIIVNAEGRRFVDEGADFRNYTYAKYGRRILEQPHQVAWQVFDSKVAGLLRDEYRIRQITKVEADTLDDLAKKMDGIDADGFLREVAAYNAAVQDDVPFDPTLLDGRGTVGLSVPKSNWAQRLDTPPFMAFQVTCGITFTFGGVRVTPGAEVVAADGGPIPGLFAAGEIMGGLFFHNYPGGTGLTAGSVFGRLAGRAAAGLAGR